MGNQSNRCDRRRDMSFRLLIVATALLIPSISWGQFPSQNPGGIVPIVRIVSRDRNRPPQGDYMTDCGSGTIVADDGKKGTVYTAWHILKDSVPNSTVVYSPNGRASYATLLAYDEENDLAALRIVSPGIKPIEVDLSGNVQGPVTVGGYGGEGGQVGLRLVAGPRQTDHNWTDPGLIFVGAIVRQGDSGGPAISNGRLIGVLWGGGHDRRTGQGMDTAVTSGVPFARFHQRIFPNGQAINLTGCSSCSMGGGSCQSCSMDGGCQSCSIDGGCQSCQSGGGQGQSVYTPRTSTGVPDRYVGTTPLSQHPEIVNLKNELNEMKQSVTLIRATPASSCSCEAKWKELDEYKSKLQEWTRTMDQRVSAIKSCNCAEKPATAEAPPNNQDKETIAQLTQTITQLNQTITQLKQELSKKPQPEKPSIVNKDAITLEGVVTRVPK